MGCAQQEGKLQLHPSVSHREMPGTPATSSPEGTTRSEDLQREPDSMTLPCDKPSFASTAFTASAFPSASETSRKTTAMFDPSRKKHSLVNKLQFISQFFQIVFVLCKVFLQIASETLHIFNVTNPSTYLFFSLNRCVEHFL